MGICYNNIGNIHLKNNRFHEAIESYSNAVQIIDEERNRIKEALDKKDLSGKEIFTNEQYRKFSKIWANRTFQLAEATFEKCYHSQFSDLNELSNVIELYEAAKNMFLNFEGIFIAKVINITIKISVVYLAQNDIVQVILEL